MNLDDRFRGGEAVVLGWTAGHTRVARALRTVERYLATVPVEASFAGADGLAADRQTFWVAATGPHRPLHDDPADLAAFDGDVEGGARGLRVLRQEPDVVAALGVLRGEIDAALDTTVRGLGLPGNALTVRYRAIRYAPVERDVAGIGVHPDGNVVSALITDRPGLIVVERAGRTTRPDPGAGTVVMPGSILTRWSDGVFPPTVHAVEIRRGDPAKCTIVGFLNFSDGADVPRSARLTDRREPFRNTVQACKVDDMDPDGDLAEFYRSRGIVVTDGGTVRFRTLAELSGEPR